MLTHDPRLRYNDARHEYSIDGRLMPSVSQIIRQISGMDRIPQNRLDVARMRGTYVHQCIEWLMNGTLDRSSIDPGLAGYVAAFERWRNEHHPEPVAQETMVSNLPLWYAGRIDLLAHIDGELWLVDYKTSSATSHHYGCQLAGYRLALQTHGINVDRAGCLYLSANRSWTMVEYDAPIYRHKFLACLTLMQGWPNE